MNKHTILCLVGPSGSGKTTLSILLKDIFNIPYICSYTTREMRPDETNGIEHIFVSVNDMPSHDKMCAYTLFGNNHYWTTFDQINEHNICSYVIDEKGILYLKDKLKDSDYNLIFIKVNRNNLSGIDTERKNRDNNRINIPDSDYNLIINNDGSIHDMVDKMYMFLFDNNELFNLSKTNFEQYYVYNLLTNIN